MSTAHSVLDATPGRRVVWRGLGPGLSRTCLAVTLAVAVIGACLVAAAVPGAASADPALTRLLRVMALIKAGMAAVVVSGVFWRLEAAVTPVGLAAYTLASTAMACGPVLIWGMTNLLLGALLLHGGLLVGAVLLWRDPATAERLQTLLARRRATGR